MHRVGIIKSIYRYPVKSMAAEEVASAELGWHGIEGDRRFAFTRAGNMSGFPWLTAGKMPGLIRYSAYHINSEDSSSPIVRVRAPDGADTGVGDESLRHQIAAAFGREVTLTRVRNGIFDDAPVSLISMTTIAAIEREAGGGYLDPRRFRPNLLVEPTGDAPVREETWVGRTIHIGDHASPPSLRVTMNDIRCVMVNLDPETAAANPHVLRTIAHSHQNRAGVYATVLSTGALSAGDGIYLDDN